MHLLKLLRLYWHLLVPLRLQRACETFILTLVCLPLRTEEPLPVVAYVAEEAGEMRHVLLRGVARKKHLDGMQRSIADAVFSWKDADVTLRMLGAKESRKVLQSTCTLVLLQSFAAARPTRYDGFIASHSLEQDSDTSQHSLQCDEFEPDPQHRKAMLKTPSVPHWVKCENS